MLCFCPCLLSSLYTEFTQTSIYKSIEVQPQDLIHPTSAYSHFFPFSFQYSIYSSLSSTPSSSKVINMVSGQNSSTHTPIKITTFNVNGLGLDVKRQSIFNNLKSDNGVIMLQETHSTSTNDKKNGKRMGRANYIFSWHLKQPPSSHQI